MKAHYLYKTEPYEHQVEAVNFCYGKEFFALFMEQGTGKTKTLIDIASNLYAEGKIEAVLLFAPNGVHEQWAREQLPIHSPVKYKVLVWNNSRSYTNTYRLFKFVEEKVDGLKWMCVNIEAMSSTTHLNEFFAFIKANKTMLVIDEATRIKNPEANRTINIIQGLADVDKVGNKVVAIHPKTAYRAVLTGMMVTNSPYDIWSMFEFLKPNFFEKTFFAFRMRYGIERKQVRPGTGRSFYRKLNASEVQMMRNMATKGQPIENIAAMMHMNVDDVRYIVQSKGVVVPYKNLPELKQLIAPYAFIKRKEECGDLPPKVYEKLYVEMNPDQHRIYKELLTDLFSQYNDKDLNVANKLTLVVRLQQVTSGFFPYEDNGERKLEQIGSKNAKIEAVIDDLDECSTFPVLIFCRFKAEVELTAERLRKAREDLRIAYVHGGVIGAPRTTLIEQFKASEIDVMVATPGTLGIGQNLQVASLTYYMSNSHSLEDREQSEDRTHRDGQKATTVVYKDVIVKNSIDERVYAVLKQKKRLLDYMRSMSVYDFLEETPSAEGESQ